MNTIPFDTLKFANRLKAVGFTDTQAETIVEIQREASNETLHHAIHDFHLDDIATKRDLKELERDIKAMEVGLKRDLVDVEMRLQHQIELLRSDTARQIAEMNQRIAETNQRIAETKSDLTRWIISAGFL